MARRENKGAAIPTRLTAPIDNVVTSFSINSSTGWPTGGANGNFFVTLDPGTVDEERVLVGAQAGGSCTSVTRGVDNTTAKAHAVGVDGSVIHSSAAVDYDEANRHINITTDDNHTQYMKTDGTRHDLNARHLYNAALGTRPVPVAVGTALAAGTGATAAAGDHVHVVGTGAVSLSNMFAAGVVDTAALAALGVTSAKLAAASVIAGKVAAGGVSTTAELANAIVTQAKLASEAGTSFAPNFTGHGVVLGTGGVQSGIYLKFGRLVVAFAGFDLGTAGANVTAVVEWELPVAADAAAMAVGVAGYGAGRAFIAGARYSASAVIGTTVITNFASIGTVWDANTPANWDNNDAFRSVAVYFAAS